MIWAACLPSAHPSVPDSPSPSGSGAAPAGSPSFLAAGVADARRLWNQLDVAESAACTVSRGPAPIGVDAAIGVDAPIGVDAAATADQSFVDRSSGAERAALL